MGAARLPATLLPRPRAPSAPSQHASAVPGRHLQVRHATFVPRHRRPYQFTQVVQLSDGSTYTQRTTSPVPLYRSAKDSRNHLLWQPSEKSLRNVELDEAGKLAAFRARFGRGWDMVGADAEKEGAADAAAAPEAGGEQQAAAEARAEDDGSSSLSDLISGYAAMGDVQGGGGISAKEQAKKDKSQKKKK